jgi:hypothetical protein
MSYDVEILQYHNVCVILRVVLRERVRYSTYEVNLNM